MAKYCMKCGGQCADQAMQCPRCGAMLGMQNSGHVSQRPSGGGSQFSGGYASPKEMQSIDGMRPQESNGKSVASLVLGIVGVIAWCLPILGLPVGVIGLIMGIQGYNRSNAKGMAMAGIVLSIICLVLTIINSSIGAYMGSQGMLFN